MGAGCCSKLMDGKLYVDHNVIVNRYHRPTP